jgi:NADH-quinone oxidoreductase subunit H
VVVYVLLVFAGFPVGVIFMNWFERKVMAHMQVRIGPMRVGPHGLLQPIADALKLIIKEDLMPANADKIVFWFAPGLRGDDRVLRIHRGSLRPARMPSRT